MTAIRVLFAVCFIAGSVFADNSYFLNPPGAEWGWLGPTNFSILALDATPDGTVIGGSYASGGSSYYPSIIQLAGNPVVEVASTNYTSAPSQSYLYDIVPVLGSGDVLEGFVFAGQQNYNSPPYSGPWVWLVKTDTNLAWEWEAHVGIVGNGGGAKAVAKHGTGYLVGGWDGLLAGGGPPGWLGEFDGDGNLQDPYADGLRIFEVNGIEPVPSGGFVLCTDKGARKLDASLAEQWTSGSLNDYAATSVAPDGSIYGLFIINLEKYIVKLDSDGNALWTNQCPANSFYDLEAIADGVFVVGKMITDVVYETSALWLIKIDDSGAYSFEMQFSDGGYNSGRKIETSADGDLLVAGQARVDGITRPWVFEIPSDLQAANPVFSMIPESPLFRDQQAMFDASASTPGPGDTIATWQWDFGDNETNTGEVVYHSFTEPGVYDVTLTVVTGNGIRNSVTEQVEVTGLALQWERLFGYSWSDIANDIVQARDGGFIIAGLRHGQYFSWDQLWLLKTDDRGIVDWENFYDGDPNGSEQGISILQAPDGGYMIAVEHEYYDPVLGYTSDGMMVKIDEDGSLLAPTAYLGNSNLTEYISDMALADGGGYYVSGSVTSRPWLAKTDTDGIAMWDRSYTNESTFARNGVGVSPSIYGGCLLLTRSSEYNCTFRLNASGEVINVVTNELNGNWVGPPEPSTNRFDIVGSAGDGIAFQRYEYGGERGIGWNQEEDYDDIRAVGIHAAPSPDGGYLVLGDGVISGQYYRELVLIRTRSSGELQWLEIYPGTTNINEEAVASIAQTNNSYVVLAKRDIGTSRVWLFKLAPNHPPVPDLQIPAVVSFAGSLVAMDASASSDRDGTIDIYEWDFGDGTQTNGPAIIDYTYPNPGTYTVRLTVVDNEGAERSIEESVFIVGVVVDDGDIVPDESIITNAPHEDPYHFPREGAPVLLKWETAKGVYVRFTAPSSTTRTLQFIFEDPVATNGWTLYRMPNWTPTSYTVLDPHTIEVYVNTVAGENEIAFVLADLHPQPVILGPVQTNATRLALTFDTWTSVVYRVELTPGLVESNWNTVLHAQNPTDPLIIESTTGTHSQETFYVELPTNPSAFFRLNLTNAVPE